MTIELLARIELLEKENKELKESLHQASIGIQELIEQNIECPTTCEKLKQENEKLNHYKLLYQKVKERNDKAIEYIKEQGCYEEDTKVFCDDLNYYAIPKLLEILKGNNENI